MKREDVITMAKEAGAETRTVPGVGVHVVYNDNRITNFIERFAALVAAAERERVAVAIDKKLTEGRSPMGRMAAEFIRALGDE